MIIESEKIFSQVITEKLNIALDNTMEVLLNKLKDYIYDDVYMVESISDNPWWYDKNNAYGLNRTGEFMESWEKTKATLLGDGSFCEISQVLSSMKQTILGGNIAHKDREDLAKIIETGSGYNFGQMEGTARPFWKDFMIYVDENIDSIFISECKKVGLNLGTTLSIK
jgi:hypothetical protein